RSRTSSIAGCADPEPTRVAGAPSKRTSAVPRVGSNIVWGCTSTPSAVASTINSAVCPSSSAETTKISARSPSITSVLWPFSTWPCVAGVAVVMGASNALVPGSARAAAPMDAPEARSVMTLDAWPVSAAKISGNAMTAVAKYGTGVNARPSSSSTTTSSIWPNPDPPWASGTARPGNSSCSHRSVHNCRSNRLPDSMRASNPLSGARAVKNSRIIWPNCSCSVVNAYRIDPYLYRVLLATERGAAVDDQHLTGDVTGTRRVQDAHGVGDLRGIGETSHRNGIEEICFDVVRHRIHHRRIYRSRGDRIGSDAASGALHGHSAHERNEAALGGGIIGLTETAERRGRGNADDRTATTVTHGLQRALAAQKRAAQMHVHDLLPFVVGHLFQRAVTQDA